MRVGEDLKLYPSSFLAIEEDFKLIVNKLIKNMDLCKLLYYPEKNCLEKEITQEQILSLINKQVRIEPLVEFDDDVFCNIVISFDNFIPTSNPEFRDNVISFDIVCDSRNCNLGDFKLRYYKIAGLIDAMFNDKKLSGIGTLSFLGGNLLALGSDYQGITLNYSATHGSEVANVK